MTWFSLWTYGVLMWSYSVLVGDSRVFCGLTVFLHKFVTSQYRAKGCNLFILLIKTLHSDENKKVFSITISSNLVIEDYIECRPIHFYQ